VPQSLFPSTGFPRVAVRDLHQVTGTQAEDAGPERPAPRLLAFADWAAGRQAHQASAPVISSGLLGLSPSRSRRTAARIPSSETVAAAPSATAIPKACGFWSGGRRRRGTRGSAAGGRARPSRRSRPARWGSSSGLVESKPSWLRASLSMRSHRAARASRRGTLALAGDARVTGAQSLCRFSDHASPRARARSHGEQASGPKSAGGRGRCAAALSDRVPSRTSRSAYRSPSSGTGAASPRAGVVPRACESASGGSPGLCRLGNEARSARAPGSFR
jgi:hypothetical protein